MTPLVAITGASRGIGLEFVRQYTAAGWRVFAGCRSAESARELSRISESSQGRVLVHPWDVTNRHQRQSAAEILKKMQIALLINNAGTAGQRDARIGAVDEALWIETLRLNTVAPFMVIESLVDAFASSSKRMVVNISSILGSIEMNETGRNYLYRSSKAALNAVTKCAAIDLKPRGITVVSLHPGWVRTDMGGSRADLAVHESVVSMIALIDRLSIEDSGRFFSYDGKQLPW